MDLDDLLATAFRHGADSLQFRPGSPPLAYVGKRPMPLSHPVATADSINALIAGIASELEQATFVGTGALEGQYTPDPKRGLPDMVYRARQTPNGPAVAFRPGAAVAAAEPVAA
ncbi:MAG: hypothetical protein KC613_19545, partial [Myxococcales bacterium]|nr:hypothetical protein [Myxococcales bacterium]